MIEIFSEYSKKNLLLELVENFVKYDFKYLV